MTALRSMPLWARLVFLALPAAGAATAVVAASTAISAAIGDGAAAPDAISVFGHELARLAARYTVLGSAPVAVLALLVLLFMGGYGRGYGSRRGERDDEYQPEPVADFLGRLASGLAVLCGVGLLCQLVLPAQAGVWSPV